MALKGVLRNATERDLLFVVYVVLALLAFAAKIYVFAQAWFSYPCHSTHDIDGWCLTVGFAGPFSDAWSNRSLFNARFSATFHLTLAIAAIACATYFIVRRHPRARAIADCCGLAVVLTGLIQSLLLDDIS